jgi:tetratricopeptide (TPR) repeat protein
MKTKLTLIFTLIFTLLACSDPAADRQEAARLAGQAVQAVQANNPAEAAALLERAGQLDPENPEYPNQQGAILLQSGRNAEAKLLFEKVVGLNARHGRGQYNLGVALQALEDYEGAASAYAKAAEINPEAPQIYYNLGIVRAKLGDKEAAARAFREFIKIAPANLKGPVAEARRRLQALGSAAPAGPAAPGQLPGQP